MNERARTTTEINVVWLPAGVLLGVGVGSHALIRNTVFREETIADKALHAQITDTKHIIEGKEGAIDAIEDAQAKAQKTDLSTDDTSLNQAKELITGTLDRDRTELQTLTAQSKQYDRADNIAGISSIGIGAAAAAAACVWAVRTNRKRAQAAWHAGMRARNS